MDEERRVSILHREREDFDKEFDEDFYKDFWQYSNIQTIKYSNIKYLKDMDEERRVSILHREREEEEQRQNHILDQVGKQRERKQELKWKRKIKKEKTRP